MITCAWYLQLQYTATLRCQGYIVSYKCDSTNSLYVWAKDKSPLLYYSHNVNGDCSSFHNTWNPAWKTHTNTWTTLISQPPQPDKLIDNVSHVHHTTHSLLSGMHFPFSPYSHLVRCHVTPLHTEGGHGTPDSRAWLKMHHIQTIYSTWLHTDS